MGATASTTPGRSAAASMMEGGSDATSNDATSDDVLSGAVSDSSPDEAKRQPNVSHSDRDTMVDVAPVAEDTKEGIIRTPPSNKPLQLLLLPGNTLKLIGPPPPQILPVRRALGGDTGLESVRGLSPSFSLQGVKIFNHPMRSNIEISRWLDDHRAMAASRVDGSHRSGVSATYWKTQLDPDKGCIRLLQFGDLQEPRIDFRFVVYPIEESPPYIALSYAWGSAWPEKSVFIDGMAITVRENLWEALQMIRRNAHHIWKAAKLDCSYRRCSALYLWVDALCIDQDNSAEKSLQVTIMDEIFKRASLVLVWLGINSDNYKLANKGIPPYPSSPIRHHFTAKPNWGNRNHRSSILRILSRPYWERLWIVQEFLLAKEVLLFYGDQYFWGQDLFRTLSALDADPIHRDTNATKLVFAKFSESTDRYRLFGRCEPSLKILRELVVEWKSQECRDIRDKIFAFLGLAQHMSATDDSIMVQPDYQKPLQEVFAEFVRFQIMTENQVQLTPDDDPLRLDDDCRVIGLQILGFSADDPDVKAVLEELWEFTLSRMRRKDKMFKRRPVHKTIPEEDSEQLKISL